MTKEQIKYMVDRFLAWKLPEDFSPDAGISFKREYNEHTPCPARHEPVGTNLLNAAQATAMVEHILEGVEQDTVSRKQLVRILAKADTHVKAAEIVNKVPDKGLVEIRDMLREVVRESLSN